MKILSYRGGEVDILVYFPEPLGDLEVARRRFLQFQDLIRGWHGWKGPFSGLTGKLEVSQAVNLAR